MPVSDVPTKGGGHGIRPVLCHQQVLETLLLSGVLTLVLEEDGTAVDSEDFFQLLEDDTCLMVLEQGQSWSPQVRGPSGCLGHQSFLVLPIFPSLSPTLGALGNTNIRQYWGDRRGLTQH